MPFHNDYRPKNFDKVIGNKTTVKSLKAKVKDKKRPHTYLFSGPYGCGKTTLARIFAKELGADEKAGIREHNCADYTGVGDIRKILHEDMITLPLVGNVKVFIMDEVHRLSANAQDSLLKPTEEPYDHVYFLFCSTEPGKIKTTLKSRCAKYKVSRLQEDEMIDLLLNVVEKENLDIDEKMIDIILRESEGIPRDALTLLEKCKGIENLNNIEFLVGGEETPIEVIDLVRMVAKGRTSSSSVFSIYSKVTTDPESVRRVMLAYLDKCLRGGKDAERFARLIDIFSTSLVDSGRAGLTLMLYDAVKGE